MIIGIKKDLNDILNSDDWEIERYVPKPTPSFILAKPPSLIRIKMTPSNKGNSGLVAAIANSTVTIVLVGIVVALGFITLIILSVSLSQHKNAGTDAYANMCNTPACLRHAGIAVEVMNSSADLCYDMYNFACGNFENVYANPNVYRLDFRDVIQNDIKTKIMNIFNEDKPNPSTDPAEYSLKQFYSVCVDDFVNTNRGAFPLISDMAEIGGWYPIGTFQFDKKFVFQTALEKSHTFYGADPYFTISAVEDAVSSVGSQASADYVIRIDVPHLGFDDYSPYILNTSAIQDYKAYIKQVLEYFVADYGQTPSQDDIDQGVADIVQIETDIANILSKRKQSSDNILTIAQLNATYGGIINFDELIKVYFKEANLKSEQPVHLREGDYLHKLVAYLGDTTTPENTRLRNTYMMWKIATNILQDLGEKYSHAVQLWEFTKTGDKVYETTSDRCQRLASDSFSVALGNLFVRNNFGSDANARVASLGTNMFAALQDRIQSNSWMTQDTKTAALAKLSNTLQKFGYPNWLSDIAAVNNFYKGLMNITDSHYLNRLAIEDWHRQLATRNIIKGKIDKDDWLIDIYAADVSTNQEEVSVYVPIGILQVPIFDPSVPRYINYGFLGHYLGVGEVQLVDRNGYNYDQYGAFVAPPWYDPASLGVYDNAHICYENLFDNSSNFVNQQASDAMEGVNALNLAIAGYKSSQKSSNVDHSVLPGFQDFTNLQGLFISFAQSYCEYRIDTSMKTYSSDRLNVILGQSKEFQSAFNCPKDSPYVGQIQCDNI